LVLACHAPDETLPNAPGRATGLRATLSDNAPARIPCEGKGALSCKGAKWCLNQHGLN